MKYIFLGATLVASCAFAMEEGSLLMPKVKLSQDASDLIFYSKCSSDTVCTFSVDDVTLDEKTRENLTALRTILQKKINNKELAFTDLQNISKNVHVAIALLALLQGKKRDLMINQLAGYAVEHEGINLLQFLEWHGFKGNRLSANILEQIEQYAKTQNRETREYLLSLRNPREYMDE